MEHMKFLYMLFVQNITQLVLAIHSNNIHGTISLDFTKLNMLWWENKFSVAPKYSLICSRLHPPSILSWIILCDNWLVYIMASLFCCYIYIYKHGISYFVQMKYLMKRPYFEIISRSLDLTCPFEHGKVPIYCSQRERERERLTNIVISWYIKVCGCYLIRSFMISNFYRLDSHNKTGVALANLHWNMCWNWTENQTSLDLIMIIGSSCFVDFLIEFIGLPNCVSLLRV